VPQRNEVTNILKNNDFVHVPQPGMKIATD